MLIVIINVKHAMIGIILIVRAAILPIIEPQFHITLIITAHAFMDMLILVLKFAKNVLI